MMNRESFVHAQRFTVEFSYPVVFTRNVFAPDNLLLVDTLDLRGDKRLHEVLVFVDEGVARGNEGLLPSIEAYAAQHADRLKLAMEPRAVTGGEAIKNDYRLTMEVVDTILECRLCRHSYVVAIGGGAVLDAVGFAASIVHRGLRLVRMPSTVLAQNDAGIGVKNGMNLHGGKNTIGTFAAPHAVLNDFNLLRSLSDEDWRNGISEAFKVAIIRDAEFLDWLCAKTTALAARDEPVMEELVRRCALHHLDHIANSGDAFESGSARPLDFGHWAAHRLECTSNYAIGHGSAVATGLALDCCYAAEKGWLDHEARDRIVAGLHAVGFPLWHAELEQRLGGGRLALLQGLDDFREHLGGQLTLAMPDGLGRQQDVNEVDEPLMEAALQHLKQTSCALRDS